MDIIYGPLNEILMFEACETQKCVNVTITDDGVDETFTYHLRRTTSLDPRIILDSVNGRIVVVDNDCEIHIASCVFCYIYSSCATC